MGSEYNLDEERNRMVYSKESANIISSVNDADADHSDPYEREEVDVLSTIPKRAVPNANVPEKIVICLDSCELDSASPFEFSDLKNVNEDNCSSLDMIKRAIEIFLHSKQAINSDTQFALVVLTEKESIWVHHFTKNVTDIMNAVNIIEKYDCGVEKFDLSPLFNLIYEKSDLPDVSRDYKLIPPENVIRVILMYNRSKCVPTLFKKEMYSLLKEHPYFTVDVLYTHEEGCENYKCKEIFGCLEDLDNGYSYIYQVKKSAKEIFESSAKLLAHPLQRPLQKYSSYILNQ